jgi:hypothetical protein
MSAVAAGGTATIPAVILATFFRTYSALSKTETALKPDDLASRIKVQTASEKKKLPWLKLARFGDRKTNKGSLRSDANLLAIDGVEADYDGEKIPFAEARDILKKAGVWQSSTPRHRIPRMRRAGASFVRRPANSPPPSVIACLLA